MRALIVTAAGVVLWHLRFDNTDQSGIIITSGTIDQVKPGNPASTVHAVAALALVCVVCRCRTVVKVRVVYFTLLSRRVVVGIAGLRATAIAATC